MKFTYSSIAGTVCAFLLITALGACAARQDMVQLSMQCDQGINAAYDELNYSASKGLDGTVSWMKAASLLAAARTQQQFEKYPACIDKVRRARFYIDQSQR